MLFIYKSLDPNGTAREGSIEALNIDVAINSLQRRGLVISSIKPQEKTGLLSKNITLFEHVSYKDIVILSRQMSTLFAAQVSALRVFRLLSEETENKLLARTLRQVSDDLQGGSSISKALAKHPKVFTDFYVNMIKSGEESGKLDQILLYLADYLDRTYEVTAKAKNALIYPAFVIFTFFAVMLLMFTIVIPNIAKILVDGGQAIPVYTQVVLDISNFLIHYGFILLIALAIVGYIFYRSQKRVDGRMSFDRFKLAVPYLGSLYRKLYLARIAENMNTMLLSAIPIIKALEITSTVVGSPVYEEILKTTVVAVRAGSSLSDSLAQHKEIPGIMIQMTKVGEETGELGSILQSLAKFYNREVINAVDTMVDLIEPAMIVLLGIGVGILMASVLIPIYNLSAAQ